MPERRNANLFEILIGQVTQNGEINVVLGKALSVVPETELFEPVPQSAASLPGISIVSFSISRTRCIHPARKGL
jgi:hypothetical protein